MSFRLEQAQQTVTISALRGPALLRFYQLHIPDDLHLTHPVVTTSTRTELEDAEQKLEAEEVTPLNQTKLYK